MERIEPELVKPIMDYKANPHPAAADAFFKAVRPIIDTGVTTYGGKNANPMMRTRARRVVLDSVSKYDPNKASFKTYAMNQMRTLQRYGARQQQAISVPEGVALSAGHLREAEAELRDRLAGRDPSDAELADHTGLSRKRIAYVRSYRPGMAEGQVAQAGSAEGGESFEPAVEQADPTTRLAEFLYPDLDPHDQVILEYTLGLNGSPRLPGNVLAQRVGLSPGAISQRKARLDARLQALRETGIF